MSKVSSSSLKHILQFAIPLITGQVGQMLLGVGDMMVAGRYSKEVVSATGISSSIFGMFLMVGLGLTFAFAPLLAKHMGEGKTPRAFLPTILTHCTMFSAILLFSMLIFYKVGFGFIDLSPTIAEMCKEYFWIVSLSIFPILIFQGIKEYLQVQKDIWFANILVIVANISNVLLNIVLCFGLFGFPEMGAKGLAIATLTNRILMMIGLLYYVRKDLFQPFKFVKPFFMESLSLGLPICAAILMEVSIFTVVTVLIGKMDVVSSAAHNIILNLASFSFMIPMAIGNAMATLVALALSEKKIEEAKTIAMSGLTISIGYEIMTMLIFTFFPTLLLSIYTDKLDVIAVGSELLIFAAFFQIPDGIQATLSGILRGFSITRPVMILTLLGYWVVGLPLGAILAYKFNYGAKGLWMGLAMSLSVMAVTLFILFLKTTREQKLNIEEISVA